MEGKVEPTARAAKTISQLRRVSPNLDSDCEAAYAVHFDQSAEPAVTIEYAVGAGRHASSLHAAGLAQEYLRRGELPPERIVVDRAGNAQPR